MHFRKMEMVPGVPRHVLVSYISEPSIIARLKEYLRQGVRYSDHLSLTGILF